MNHAATVGIFGLVLAAALGGGATAASVAGVMSFGDGGRQRGHRVPEATVTQRAAGGLLVAQDGLRLVPDARVAHPGLFTFRVVGDGGRAVVDYVQQHGREMHLIVASRDLRTFHHLHPTMDPVGRWSVDLPDLPPGAYRAYADFQATGSSPITLGIDLTVPGRTSSPGPLAPSASDAVDGYEVELDGRLSGPLLRLPARRRGPDRSVRPRHRRHPPRRDRPVTAVDGTLVAVAEESRTQEATP